MVWDVRTCVAGHMVSCAAVGSTTTDRGSMNAGSAAVAGTARSTTRTADGLFHVVARTRLGGINVHTALRLVPGPCTSGASRRRVSSPSTTGVPYSTSISASASSAASGLRATRRRSPCPRSWSPGRGSACAATCVRCDGPGARHADGALGRGRRRCRRDHARRLLRRRRAMLVRACAMGRAARECSIGQCDVVGPAGASGDQPRSCGPGFTDLGSTYA